MFAEILEKINNSPASLKGKKNIPLAMLIGFAAIQAAPADLMASEQKEIIYAKVVKSKQLTREAITYENQEICAEIRRKVATKGEGKSGGVSEIVGTILGAVAGGVIGNQFGSSDGKIAATIAGTAAGSYFGGKAAAEAPAPQDVYEISQECRTERVPVRTTVPDGYDVEATLPNGQAITGRVDEIEDGKVAVEVTSSYRLK